jgi:hypothetical protein
MFPCNFSLLRQPNTSCPEYNIQSTSYNEITANNSKYNQYNLVSIHSIKALLCTIHTLPASPWPPCSRWSPHMAKSIKPSNTDHNSHTQVVCASEWCGHSHHARNQCNNQDCVRHSVTYCQNNQKPLESSSPSVNASTLDQRWNHPSSRIILSPYLPLDTLARRQKLLVKNLTFCRKRKQLLLLLQCDFAPSRPARKQNKTSK